MAEIIHKEIEYYFSINDTGVISGATLWEANKAYIRGILILIGAGKKKERIKKMSTLMDEIHRLEQEHKKYKGQRQETFHQLVGKKDELKDIMDQESKRTFHRIAKERYLGGNTAGKHLAKMLKKKKKEINYIEKIQKKRRNGIQN